MKNFICGTGFGIAFCAVLFVAYSFLRPVPAATADLDMSIEDMGYSYVDFKYKDLVLYDIGVKVNNELYVRPDKLMTFLGKEIQYANEGEQLIITERPENSIKESTAAALGQTNKQNIGEILDKKFTSQHWEADPETEGKLVFRGVDSQKDQYEIVFLINKSGEMTIQTIFINGTELSEEAKSEKIKNIFEAK